MQIGLRKLIRRVRARAGQSVVEYAIILVLIVMVSFLVLTAIGTKTNKSIEPVADGLQ
jgi:Flp pilus assembly pilin Flp